MVKIKFVKKGTMKPMPPFKTLEEEANFWDNHDITEDIDENTKIGFHHAPKTDTLTVRFDPQDIQKLREEALHLGIGPTTLARMWIKERLKSQSSSNK